MTAKDQRCLIVATAANHGPYLLEWVAWWQMAGASQILIYAQASEDGTEEMLARLAELGHIRVEPLPEGEGSAEARAFAAAMSHSVYAASDWALPVQIEDFVVVDRGRQTLGELIDAFGAADAIALPLRRFDTSGPFRDDLQVAMHTHGEPPQAMRRRRRRTLVLRAGKPQELTLREPVWEEAADPAEILLDAGVAVVNSYPRRQVVDPAEARKWPGDNTLVPKIDPLVERLSQFHNDTELKRLHTAAVLWHQDGDNAETGDVDALFDDDAPEPSGDVPAPATPLASDTRQKAPYRYANRRKMLASLPKGARCAEVGVWEGAFSADILEVTEPEELVLIDPWELLATLGPENHTHRRHADPDFMSRMHASVRERYAGLPNVTIRKGFSEDVLASYPDNYFDWVYIDGNHLYDFVRRDVEISFRKVRKGGIIAGDDFTWELDGRAHVRDAVIDALQSQGRPAKPRVMGAQYLITVDK